MRVSAPFTIEANWDTLKDHETFVFVPNKEGEGSPPFRFIDRGCRAAESLCETEYPFACVSRDAPGPGDEVTTVLQLLDGTYEYWIELKGQSNAGDLTVLLRGAGGAVVASWTSPANSGDPSLGWHVFNVDGATGVVTSIDVLGNNALPTVAHSDNLNVCPFPPSP